MVSTKDKTIQKKSSVKQKKPVRRKKGGFARLFGIILAMFYLFALWNWVFHEGVETSILHTGLLEIKVPSEGVLIRSETQIFAQSDGIVIPKADNGQRIPNKGTIAVLVDKSSSGLISSIESMEREIIRRVIEESADNPYNDPVLREKVQKEVNRLTNAAVSKNLRFVNEIRIVLERLLYQRNKAVFEQQDDRLYLQKEKSELEQLKKTLDEKAVTVKADYSGLVVWSSEEAYEKYAPDDISLLTTSDLTYDEKKHAKVSIESIAADKSFPTKKGQIFAKLINNEKSWYVCVVDNKYAQRLIAGINIVLRIDNIDIDIPCTVESVQPAGDKTKVVLSFDSMIEQTIHLRHVRADLVISSINGIKVPVRSLANRNYVDNTADIIVVRFNRANVKRVKILEEQDTYAIVEAASDVNEIDPIRVFDIYVVNPRNVEQGQVIEQ